MTAQRIKKFLAALLTMVLLTASVPVFAASTATVTTDSLVAYTTPYLDTAEKAGTLSKGTRITVSAVSEGIAKVIIKGKHYYVDASKLSFDSNAVPSNPAQSGSTPAPSQPAAPSVSEEREATVVADKMVVYKSASKSADKWGTVSKGVKVKVLATNGAWAAIQVAGKIGYCAYSGLSIYPQQSGTDAPAQETPAPTQAPAQSGDKQYAVNGKGICIALDDLRMYKQPNTFDGYYGTFKAGRELEVTAVSGDWAKISYKGKTGYVLRSGLRPATEADGIDTGNMTSASGYTHQTVTSTKLYTKPDTGSNSVAVLPAGTKILVKGVSGGWAKVSYDGMNRYAKEENLVEIDQKVAGLVVVAQAKLYGSTNVTAAALTTIPEGTSVDVYGVSGDWAKVVYNEQKGYMQTSALVTGSASYTPLKSGDSGTNVQALQNRLETLGYFDGVPAGNYGSITTAAVKRFQEQKGLNVTGIANNATQAALYAKSAPESSLFYATLKSGANATYVTRLQTRLLYKNYYSDSIDGDYGTNTVAAVKAFQKNAKLEQTGIADPATLRALFAPGAPAGTISKPAGSNGTPSLDPPNVTSDNEDIETVIRYALAQLGKPYVYGASGPDAFDCSGLTYYCFKKIGITLPRTAYDVGYSSALGPRIAYDDLKRGDIVCFNTIADNDLSDHVGIYLGDGKFIHAPHTGSDVIVASMATGYYVRNFSWARRVIK